MSGCKRRRYHDRVLSSMIVRCLQRCAHHFRCEDVLFIFGTKACGIDQCARCESCDRDLRCEKPFDARALPLDGVAQHGARATERHLRTKTLATEDPLAHGCHPARMRPTARLGRSGRGVRCRAERGDAAKCGRMGWSGQRCGVMGCGGVR